MQNGLEQKNQSGRGDEFDSTYMHQGNVNQPYGMAPTSESYVPNYYGHIPFPYMGGGTEWSSGSDSMPYMAGYGGETQQPGFVPDAMFSHPQAPLGNTAAYYNQPYNYFPANNDFSAWGAPNTGTGIPENAGSGFSQQNPTPYNGDYYHSVMPANPQDYLGGNDVLPTASNNMVQHSNQRAAMPGVGGNNVMSGGDVAVKMPISSASNGMKMVEQGLQNMSLVVPSVDSDSMKPQVQQNVSLPMPGGSIPAPTQNVIMSGTSISAPMGQSGSGSNTNNAPVPGSNAPKPVSWAAIASKPAKPQPKPKAKSAAGPGLPPPIKHNMDIGTWDNSLPPQPKGPARGSMPGQSNAPQRWSAPRQGGNGQGYGSGDGQGTNYGNLGTENSSPSDGSGRGNVPQLNNDEIGNAVLDKLRSENDYNPKRLTLDVRNARFFVIKSYSEDDIHRSIKYNIWCSTEHGNKRLDAAYNAQQGRGPVILLFSVNGSGHFCGVAEMLTPIDYSKRAGVWAQDKWKGKFQVKWIYAKDVPNSLLRHIRLENNENKPVTNSRDTQEVPAEKGRQVLEIISNYKHQTSIFDDFSHYERRQVEEEGQRAKRNDQMRSRDNVWRGDRQPSRPQESSKN